ncbi:MAG TPA: Ig-like domain-containing protein [Solirubrobacteraceae bacterium]|jgi:hypothetical protein
MRFRLPACLLAFAALLAAAPAAHAVVPGMVIGPRTTGENSDQVDRAARGGAEWVRTFVDWSSAEPARGTLSDFWLKYFDARVAKAQADGLKVIMVVTRSPGWATGTGDLNRPPADPATYASFLRRYAQHFAGKVDAWEIWNEPDEAATWSPAPDPAAYARLLGPAHAAVKAADPGARVVLGGLVGNDYRYLEGVYAAGGKGSFDAVGVHTDTACLTSPPEEQYREPDGRIGRFSFTGYREVRRTMLDRGDDKPIWMTELGWSTLRETCAVGGRAGTKLSGVSEDQQADFLTRAYRCLQNDPYVALALWFSVQDVDKSPSRYDHRLGLLRDDGSKKPAYGRFEAFARAGADRPASRCGAAVDAAAPVVRILAPAADGVFAGPLRVSARASDDQGVRRMELWIDGAKVPGSQPGGKLVRTWQGAKRLPLGRHVVTIKARDSAGNIGEQSLAVTRVDERSLTVPAAHLRLKVKRVGGSRIRLSGRVRAPGSPVKPTGKVRMRLQVRRGRGWKTYSRFTKDMRPFRFTATVRRSGYWRVRAFYDARRPFRDSRAVVKRLGGF